ncbi:hypothetical protein HUW64_010755 [Staphylococcus epidermidis]|uniref:hypothetical protein n=1 Tax=Staphylococcus epidermidis TaxID=1282 RepID=UPI00066BA33A|nr:hypothetical protein [Staphylococcus epidermidis]MBF2163223.1 hypothetical protein [Staphylococcus epidermidis]MBM6057817.1 hypothetical protein [Staphylococcus epidermidis]MBV2115601.1 hypothetical protein [Staphylococcus epidermidis]MCG1806576.1 hypothetical protein [Staphylococcus epidermidis]MCG2175513.1 hypothetical protein [Staphylococcus epidermidis]
MECIYEILKSIFSFIKFLYQNFSFPVLFLIIIFLFKEQIKKVLTDFTVGEFQFPSGAIKVTRKGIEKDQQEYLRQFEKENDKSIELDADEMSSKIGELFGCEYKDGLPIDNSDGGDSHKSESYSSVVFNAHLFSMVTSEDSLEEEYNFFGFKETIISLYTAYLSNYKNDKWATKGGAPYYVSNREESLEKKAFDIITGYYLEAMNTRKEWDFNTIKSYQKLIRVVLVSYQIIEREFMEKNEE